MFLPQPQDAVHKAWLYRLLTAIVDDEILRQQFCFKGGTCAALLGFLNRFSIDLDFDFLGRPTEVVSIRQRLLAIFRDLDLRLTDASRTGLQFFLKYQAPLGQRNTLKLEAQFPPPKTNQYKTFFIPDIDRTVRCQTRETMVANKLVAVLDRYHKHSSIAGRDIYDIHQFFLRGYGYKEEVIEERWKMSVLDFFQELTEFIKIHVTQTLLDQDLSTLISLEEFRVIRKRLKMETVVFLQDELERITRGGERQGSN